MDRKLFCQISPLTYRISVAKCRLLRYSRDFILPLRFAKIIGSQRLPYTVYQHRSLIRRRLGNVVLQLQENKAVNLSIAAPKVSGVIIFPGETFSFWKLVGNCTAKKGYLPGLTINAGKVEQDIGGGMCQFTNLIHWMVLHSPLHITEHHHHDGIDLFPDYGRQVPFGVGTSIFYNYVDYRFYNPTDRAFQLITWVEEEYLSGLLLTDQPLDVTYHIKKEQEQFLKEQGQVYRTGKIYRNTVRKSDGALICRELLKDNHARVLYDTAGLQISAVDEEASWSDGVKIQP